MPLGMRGLNRELWCWTGVSPHLRAEPLSSHVFWLGLIKIQALQQNGGLDLEFPKLQDCRVRNFVIGSCSEATIWIYFCVPSWKQWLALRRKPVSWSETCSSASQGILRAMANFNCRTAQFWVASRKKRRDCGEEGARNNNSPKIIPYICWHFQKSATNSTAWNNPTIPLQRGRSRGRKGADAYRNL